MLKNCWIKLVPILFSVKFDILLNLNNLYGVSRPQAVPNASASRKGGCVMRAVFFAAAIAIVAVPSMVLAQTPQVAPVRVEFTRPGGTPGTARGVVKPSETYMIAPAQPDAGNTRKPRKRR
jgi:hypothetical protein